MNILGVIPARGGSKGVPRKNVFPLGGKPLIGHSIESAKKAKGLTHLMVSTDDAEIARVSNEFGLPVPFLRPALLATDNALSVDVMKHAVTKMESLHQIKFDYLVLLQPTTPFRQPEDIDQAIRLLIEFSCDTIVSLVDVGANHPARMYQMSSDRRMLPIIDEGTKMAPRQDLPPVYIRSGDVYACRRDVPFQYNSLLGPDTRGFAIPASRAVNIDTLRDLQIAEFLFEGRHL